MSRKNKLLLLVVIIQVLFFIGWYCLEHNKLYNPESKTIMVKTVPVDPRDYLSGNYLTLRYEFNDLWRFKGKSRNIKEASGNEIYAVLKKDGSWYVPDYVSLERPLVRDDQVVIKGKYTGNFGFIEYGVEKYFINENTKEPKREDKVEVILIVGDDLTARIKSVMINGSEFMQ
jgi:uncharacterized membrane-anchored protein